LNGRKQGGGTSSKKDPTGRTSKLGSERGNIVHQSRGQRGKNTKPKKNSMEGGGGRRGGCAVSRGTILCRIGCDGLPWQGGTKKK